MVLIVETNVGQVSDLSSTLARANRMVLIVETNVGQVSDLSSTLARANRMVLIVETNVGQVSDLSGQTGGLSHQVSRDPKRHRYMRPPFAACRYVGQVANLPPIVNRPRPEPDLYNRRGPR